VDSLYFDAEPREGFAKKWVPALTRRSTGSDQRESVGGSGVPPLLSDARNELRLMAERGFSADAATAVHDEFARRLTRMASAGFSAFTNLSSRDPAVDVLRAQYVCMQYEHLIGGTAEQLA